MTTEPAALCDNCDAGLPMSCTCPPSPTETIGELHDRLSENVWVEAYGVRIKRLADPDAEVQP